MMFMSAYENVGASTYTSSSGTKHSELISRWDNLQHCILYPQLIHVSSDAPNADYTGLHELTVGINIKFWTLLWYMEEHINNLLY